MDRDELLDSLFAAAERGDWQAFGEFFSADAMLRQNVGSPQPLATALEHLPLFTADGTTLRYENVRRFHGATASTELHDAVFTKPDGGVVRIDICVVVEFDADDKITYAHEYLDSAAAAGLVG